MSKRKPLVVLVTLIPIIWYIAISSHFKWTVSLEMLHKLKSLQASTRSLNKQYVTYNIDERTNKSLQASTRSLNKQYVTYNIDERTNKSLQASTRSLNKQYVTYNIDERTNKIISQSIDDPSLIKPEITVVTAYFNIGSFAKGSGANVFTPGKYMHWMQVFGNINNNLVAYTDSKDVYNLLTNLRRRFPSNMTKVFLIDRYNLWSFSLAKEIRSIYKQPNYPRHLPNTVNENYSCAMHAKFELVSKVLAEELFPTKYFCWLDIGLFRGLADDRKIFKLQIPKEWDQRKVAYSEVSGFNKQATIERVIKNNMVWVGGAMFLGTPEVLHNYTEDYMNTVKMLLKQRLMNTDQQVIYSLYLPSSQVKPRVEIQTFSRKVNPYDYWFYLGYLCRETWLKTQTPVKHSPINDSI